jgi:retron-type reverse transcriptase
VDRVTWQAYKANLATNLVALHEQLVNETYCPQPVVRRLIPKSHGKLRLLGLPALEDKIVAKAVAMLVEAIYEQDFCDFSYVGNRSSWVIRRQPKVCWRTVYIGGPLLPAVMLLR